MTDSAILAWAAGPNGAIQRPVAELGGAENMRRAMWARAGVTSWCLRNGSDKGRGNRKYVRIA